MRRGTYIYLLLFLALVGAYYYLNNRKASTADVTTTGTPEPPVSYLFSAEDGQPTSIHIESKTGEKVEVARGADNAWALNLPIAAKADQGAAEAAASQITTMRILNTVEDVSPDIVGLTTPEYQLTIKFTSGVERKADIGVVTPSESGYYVRNAEGKIVIVSKSSVDALIGMLTTPPYLETLTPSPIPPTETATLPATETGTPTSETTTPQP